MLVQLYNNPAVKQLEEDLKSIDLVILVDIEGANPLTYMICTSKSVACSKKKLAFYSCANFCLKHEKHIYRTVPEHEMGEILKLYRTYEFSDKLIAFTDDHICGNAWNYVNN